MKKLLIGKTLDGKDFGIDWRVLVKSRLLAMASSGGGKSWMLRKLIEVLYGHVQIIVLDIEDDFASLSELFDFLLVGKGGQVTADPRSAELLARKLLELEADAIINLYELKQHERIRFVKIFLDAMINAPKELWHQVVIFLDEAQQFAPEKTSSEATSAVIDMASRGRKRGFCLIPATQRLSKLDKDIAAECQNQLIGLANLEIDRKRAAEELGLTNKEEILALKNLEPGEFFAVGPAFDRGITKIKIGAVLTTHHEAGKIQKSRAKVRVTAKMKAMLAKLTDLPQEAEEELQDKLSLKAKVRELQMELRNQKVKVESKVEKIVDPKAVKAALSEFKVNLMVRVNEATREFKDTVMGEFKDASKLDPLWLMKYGQFGAPKPETKGPKEVVSEKGSLYLTAKPKVFRDSDFSKSDKKLGKCERAILKFLAMREGKSFTKIQIGAMTTYAGNSGSFGTSISKLMTSRLILKEANKYFINTSMKSSVLETLGSEYLEPEKDSMLAWLGQLGRCERKIFEVVTERAPEALSREELGQATGYEGLSGSFGTALSKLNTLGLIAKQGNAIVLNPEIVGL